jgi:small-conductance mechanosensitive channel
MSCLLNRTSRTFFKFLIFLIFTILIPYGASCAETPPEPNQFQEINPSQADSVVAKMSDEDVRSLLLSELSHKEVAATTSTVGLIKQTSSLLHLLDTDDSDSSSNVFFTALKQLPSDYLNTFNSMGGKGKGGVLRNILMIVAVFVAAAIAELLVRRLTANYRAQFQEKAIPDLDGPMRFIAGMMQAIPNLLHIFVFTAAAMIFFFLLPKANNPQVNYIFLALLFIVAFKRLITQLSHLFCSPDSNALRVIRIDDTVAMNVHRALVFLLSYTFSAVVFLALLNEMHLQKTSINLTAMALATLLILMLISMVLKSRHYVKGRIIEKSEQNKTRNWVIEQFAQFWHVPTILYLMIIGLIMIADMITGLQRNNSAFLLSLLLLPLYILFNGLGQWIVHVSINTLQIARIDIENPETPASQQLLAEGKEKERKLYVTTSRIMSLAILATLLVWVLSLWGIHIPYAGGITNAVFESLIALALGLTVWRFASSYIENKINESTPDTDETEESDDEWGATADRGRSYTILPMVRKFIATTLLVMVTLVILSAIGVDIGPLLAGAGVVGLAIGFGAQKLVSDVFSGFFYLLDDAFRVGEYIQAGAVSGSVESITLRNVMLRHHRGMLQIVPHSDLGSITNFMRGGIIVKFNLEFPYDADVDKIRKVIKKVGQAMLKDEEFGKDFINPVKSAGVREITASVMVIRVKFKAQPGTHFVIRREAYRRITDALAAQGIHYAHRKVIVELPEHENRTLSSEDRRLLEAGAAAELAQQEEDEKKKAQG